MFALACGLSRRKVEYVLDLAHHFGAGRIVPRRWDAMDDESVIGELIQVRGIGRWTAEMLLIFSLLRPDVLPVDDLGFRNAVWKVYGMRKPPTAKRLRQLAERWRPYRTVAVWYLWQSAGLVLPGGEKTAHRRPKKGNPMQRA